MGNTTLLRHDDATLLADTGAEVLHDICPTCHGSGEVLGVSCFTCAGETVVYRVAGYSAQLATIEAEVASLVTR